MEVAAAGAGMAEALAVTGAAIVVEDVVAAEREGAAMALVSIK